MGGVGCVVRRTVVCRIPDRWHRVQATGMPGVAAGYASQREPTAPPQTVGAQRLGPVLGARGMEAASRRQQWRHQAPVDLNEEVWQTPHAKSVGAPAPDRNNRMGRSGTGSAWVVPGGRSVRSLGMIARGAERGAPTQSASSASSSCRTSWAPAVRMCCRATRTIQSPPPPAGVPSGPPVSGKNLARTPGMLSRSAKGP